MEVRVSEVLDRAADLVARKRGWCQCQLGPYRDGQEDIYKTDANCASGAVRRAIREHSFDDVSDVHGTNWGHPAFVLLQSIVMSAIPVWNDAPGRTQAEVVAALRKAADLARAQEIPPDHGEQLPAPVKPKAKARELELA